MNEPLLTFYVIQNNEGKFFRAKGFKGAGPSWVYDLKEAKVYDKIKPARSQVTFFAKRYPELPIFDILQLNVTEYVTLPQERLRTVEVMFKEYSTPKPPEEKNIIINSNDPKMLKKYIGMIKKKRY